MKNEKIIIRGARTHNLKNINLEIPRNKLVVITGLSGSGKSSLAFDTIYAEGQRRYIESLSSYARQFLGVMDKPDVDKIEGLSPAISIDQKSVSRNPRSTVGTVTEIYDYLRLLFARVGKPHCPECGRPVSKQSPSQIADKIAKWERGTEFVILAPVVRGKKGEHRALIQEIANAGYLRLRANGEVMAASEALEMKVDRYKIHHIEAVIDRMVVEKGMDRTRLVSSIETALKIGKGLMIAAKKTSGAKTGFEDILFSEMFSCPECGINLPEIEPRLFSFNSPYGACSECTGLGSKLEVDPPLVVPNPNLTIAEGAIRPWAGISGQGWHFWELQKLAENQGFSLNVPFKSLPQKTVDLIMFGKKENGFEGVAANLERRWKETDSDWARNEMEKYMLVKKCPKCLGRRLHKEALAVTIFKENIIEISGRSIAECRKFFENILISSEFSRNDKKIAEPIIKEIIGRLKFLLDVGLDYLALERESTTLSGGEAQRIRLATQIGSRLVGVLYILDEPSIGLHPRDHQKLIATLKYLRDLGNSVLVVEHDSQTILNADWIIDLGPGAGKYGGEIIFEGTAKQLFKSNTLTGDYLTGRKKVGADSKIPNKSQIKNSPPKADKNQKHIEIKGAAENNLKNIDVKIPLGKLVCVSGVSGSGKSSLIYDILAKFLLAKFHHARLIPGKYEKIIGVENLNKAIVIDQSPIGRTPRSNPATYTGVFAPVRDIFVKTKEAKMRGYNPGRFSFNVKGGRCEACEGQGVKKIEMFFLPDVYIECEECRGRRYNKEVLEIEYKDKNIADVLKMSVVEALKFFENIPAIKQKLRTLSEVGLGYIELGQPATTLSGGEAQRIKLAAELSRRGTGKTLYILDEPTTGLHFDDIKKLLKVLLALVEKENTVLVIEHNLDIIKNADWVIDLGPDGGDKGGYIVAEGTPEDVAKNKKSHTGRYLRGK